jgi:hypothetical protein
MACTQRRIEIGLDGGQVVAARVSDEELASLRKALDKGGWHRLATEDAEVDIDLAKIVFLKTAGDDQKVGF